MNNRNSAAKRLILHDLGDAWKALGIGGKADIIDGAAIGKPCIGCFGCWTRTPGVCSIRDGFERIGARFAACEELVIVSRCTYGGFSPEVKNVLDRCIGYLLPFFTLRADGQMHHMSRYSGRLRLTVHFYGEDITPQEEGTARRLVERNALNLNAAGQSVRFHSTATEMGRCLA